MNLKLIFYIIFLTSLIFPQNEIFAQFNKQYFSETGIAKVENGARLSYSIRFIEEKELQGFGVNTVGDNTVNHQSGDIPIDVYEVKITLENISGNTLESSSPTTWSSGYSSYSGLFWAGVRFKPIQNHYSRPEQANHVAFYKKMGVSMAPNDIWTETNSFTYKETKNLF